MYRHGDLLLIFVKQIPTESTLQKSNILAYGEVTGHTHCVAGAEVFTKKEEMFLKVCEEALVTHEEHDTITLPAGNYQVVRQREFNPYERSVRSVQD